MGESDFVWPTPRVCDDPTSAGWRGLSFGRMDSASSPSASRRMTGQRHTAKDESFQTRESNQKEICCYVHLFRIDAMCIGIGLMLNALVLG